MVETSFKDFNIPKVFFYGPITMSGWMVYLIFRLTLKADGDQPMTCLGWYILVVGRICSLEGKKACVPGTAAVGAQDISLCYL